MDFIQRLISLLRTGTKPLSPSDLPAAASVYRWEAPSARAESERWHIRRTILEQKISQLRRDLDDARAELDSLHPPNEILFYKIRTAIANGDTVTFHFNAHPNMPVTLHWDGFRFEWPDAAMAMMQLAACGARCVVEKQHDTEKELDEVDE